MALPVIYDLLIWSADTLSPSEEKHLTLTPFVKCIVQIEINK